MFALYVHWPFCLKKCPYCDFNSHVRPSIDHAYWCQALLKELDHYGTETRGRVLTSVFFGGGTPSLMKADTVAQILDKVSDYWQISEYVEITHAFYDGKAVGLVNGVLDAVSPKNS